MASVGESGRGTKVSAASASVSILFPASKLKVVKYNADGISSVGKHGLSSLDKCRNVQSQFKT